MKHWTLVKLCVVLLHLAENVWCGTVIVPSLTYCAMMRAVWHLLCSLSVWRGLLMSPSLEDAWQPGLLEEDARQPGLLEEDRLDVFIDELVERVRELRARDMRVARDLVWVVGTHIRRGLTSRLPSLRRASERMRPVQEAWFAAMRQLQNVRTNANGEWAWNWWSRLRVACRAASRRYKRRRLMNQLALRLQKV